MIHFGAAGVFGSPRREEERKERFYVLKQSGSSWAFIVDRSIGLRIKKFNILKADGWNKAHIMCKRMNEGENLK